MWRRAVLTSSVLRSRQTPLSRSSQWVEPPGAEEEQRRPPGEAEQHQRRGDAAEEHDQPLGDEVHVHEHRRPGLPEVEVAGRGEVVGQVAALEVADAVGTERGRHQPVVEDTAEAVARERTDDLVHRWGDLGDHEEEGEHGERHRQVGPGLEAPDEETGRDRQAGRHEGADQEQQPPRRREARHRAGQAHEEQRGGPLAQPGRTQPGQPDPRCKGRHGVTLGPGADTPSNPLPPPDVLEA